MRLASALQASGTGPQHAFWTSPADPPVHVHCLQHQRMTGTWYSWVYCVYISCTMMIACVCVHTCVCACWTPEATKLLCCRRRIWCQATWHRVGVACPTKCAESYSVRHRCFKQLHAYTFSCPPSAAVLRVFSRNCDTGVMEFPSADKRCAAVSKQGQVRRQRRRRVPKVPECLSQPA